MAGLKDTTDKVKDKGGKKPSILGSVVKKTTQVGTGLISRTGGLVWNHLQQENPGLGNLSSPLTGIAQDLISNNRNSFLSSNRRGGNGNSNNRGNTKLDKVVKNTDDTVKETRKTRRVLEGVAGTTKKTFFEQVKANQLKQKEAQERIRQKFKEQSSKDANGNVINPITGNTGAGNDNTTKDNPLWKTLLELIGGFDLFKKAGGFLKLIAKITGLGFAFELLKTSVKKLASWLLDITGVGKIPQLIKNVAGGLKNGAKSLVSGVWDATKSGAESISNKVGKIFSRVTPEEKALTKAQNKLEKAKPGSAEHQSALKELDAAKQKAGKARFEEVKKPSLKSAAEGLIKEAPKAEVVAADAAKGLSKVGKLARVGAVAGTGIASIASGAAELAVFAAVSQVAEDALGSLIKNVYMAGTGEQTVKESLKGFVTDAKTLMKEDWQDIKDIWYKIVPQNKDLDQAVSLKSQQTVNDQLREQKNQTSSQSGGNVSVVNAPTNAQRTNVSVSVSAVDGSNRFNQQ